MAPHRAAGGLGTACLMVIYHLLLVLSTTTVCRVVVVRQGRTPRQYACSSCPRFMQEGRARVGCTKSTGACLIVGHHFEMIVNMVMIKFNLFLGFFFNHSQKKKRKKKKKRKREEGKERETEIETPASGWNRPRRRFPPPLPKASAASHSRLSRHGFLSSLESSRCDDRAVADCKDICSSRAQERKIRVFALANLHGITSKLWILLPNALVR